MTLRTALLAAGLCLGPAAALQAQATPDALPALAASTESTSVIGVSSGGYMATQLAVAWPSRFAGLGVVAAGPWGCARGELGLALGQCMFTRLGPPDLEAIEARHADYQARDLAGSDQALSKLRAFVWHGGNDRVVDPALGDALAEQLGGWLTSAEEPLRVVRDDDAAHGWPVGADSQAPAAVLSDCTAGGEGHLLACGRDIAGEAMRWLHGAPEGEPEAIGRLVRFDQSRWDARGLADAGYVFIPEVCRAGGCPVTIALHGCTMSAAEGDERFVRYSGLNAWAAADRRIVLYPQASASLANPKGCWDWWGFAESAWQLDPLHDSRDGSQVEALMAMLDRLQAAPERD